MPKIHEVVDRAHADHVRKQQSLQSPHSGPGIDNALPISTRNKMQGLLVPEGAPCVHFRN